MKIKTKTGIEIELTAEELRHFQLNNATDMKKFIEILEEGKTKTLGFDKEK